MKDLLLSRLETYLLDEEHTFVQYAAEYLEVSQQEERTEYPQGFFSSL